MKVGKDVRERVTDDTPCNKERKLSLMCLDKNGYDNTKCEAAFENFKACREFWNNVKKMRAAHRINPQLPPPEERAEIQRIYMGDRKSVV